MKTAMRRILSVGLGLALGAMALAGCSTPKDGGGAGDASSSTGERYVFKFANVVADDHPYNLGASFFKETLEKSAKDAGYDVTVEIYSNSALGGERELAESMQLGTLDMALIPGCAVSFNSKFGLIDLPYLFESREVAHAVLDGEIGQEIAADMPQESGLRLLAYWENGFRNMTNSRRPINTPADVAGITMRVPENEVYVSFFSELGANVVTMSFSELYTALQQKTVDGQENPTALIATNKLYETQSYMSLTEHFYGPAQLCFSEKIWQTLPQQLQQLLQSAAEQARDYERQQCAQLDASYLEEIEKSGTTINREIDKEQFKAYAEKVYEKYWDVYGSYIQRIQNGDY